MARRKKRSQNFNNPFAASGLLRLARAGIIFLIGIVLLFKALAAFRDGESTVMFLAAFGAAMLILSGLTGLKQGADRLAGFEPDPRSPADLSVRFQNNSQVATIGKAQRYGPGELKELLDVGTPPEGGGRSGTLGKLAQVVIPGLRFSPPEVRLTLEYIISCLFNTGIIFGLALFFLQAAATVGLDLGPVGSSIFWWTLAFVLLARWRLFVRPSTLTISLAQLRGATPGSLRGTLFFLALLAAGGAIAMSVDPATFGISQETAANVGEQLEAGANSAPAIRLVGLIIFLALGLTAMATVFWFIRMGRLSQLSGELDEEVSRVRFRRDGVGNASHFAEAMMTSLQNQPRESGDARVYNLGENIYVETQPELQKAPISKAVPFISEAIGNALLVLAALALAFNLPDLPNIEAVSNTLELGNDPTDRNLAAAWRELGQIAPWLLLFFTLGGFGKWFLGLSEVFLGETNFRSVLMRAALTGTETDVRQAIGNAAFDTYKTEVSVPFTNGVVEGASVVLHTCSFARPNRNGLMGPRSILEFGSDQGLLQQTIDEAVRSLDDLRFMPQLQQRDLDTVRESVAINAGHAEAVYHGTGAPRLPDGRPLTQAISDDSKDETET